MYFRFLTVSAAALTIVTAAQAQQAHVTFDWNWKNLATGGHVPLQPGQSAAVWLDVTFSPPPGGTIMVNNQSYTILGLNAIDFDLIAATVNGAWGLSGPGFGGTPNPDGPLTNMNANSFGRRSDLLAGSFAAWGSGPAGTPVVSPQTEFTLGSIRSAAAGQTAFAGGLPNSAGPVIEIWRGHWTPQVYNRSAVFLARQARGSSGTGASLWIYPTGTNPLETMEIYHVPAPNIDFGSGHIVHPGFSCYANCDGSTLSPILNVDDFLCFVDRFAAGDPYTNCDGSTQEPILNVDDFLCFINEFALASFCDL